MMMWLGFICMLFGALEEVLYITTFTRELPGGKPYLVAGLLLLAAGVFLSVYDGLKGRKERAQIVAESVVCPACGLPLIAACRTCPSCGEKVG